MRQIKHSFQVFSFYDRSGMEAYLEKQSEKGWLLEEIGALCWRFRRAEPRTRHFAVSYFPHASAFDAEPAEYQQRFLEFCAHDGWQLAATNAQMQIFCNEAPDPTPIETDAAIEVENIHRSVKKSFLWQWSIVPLMGLLQVGMFTWRAVTDPIGALDSNAGFYAGVCWMVALLLALTDSLGYLLWYLRAKRAAENGEFVQTKGTPRKIMTVLLVLFAAFTLFVLVHSSGKEVRIALVLAAMIILTAALVLFTIRDMKRRKLSSTRIRVGVLALVVLMVFNAVRLVNLMVIKDGSHEPAGRYEHNGFHVPYYHDELPLYVEDMVDVEDSEVYSHELSEKESLFMESLEAAQRPFWTVTAQPGLRYTVRQVKTAPLFEPVLRQTLAEFAQDYERPEPKSPGWEQHLTVDAEPWGADAAYQLSLGGEEKQRYILCYDTRIVEIDFDWEPDDAARALVGQTLGR